MHGFGTDRTSKKVTLTTRISLQPMQPIKPKNIYLPQPNLVTQQRKKNPNLDSITFLRNEFAVLEKKQAQKENRVSDKRQLVFLREANLEMVAGKVPFANATNTKPEKSYSIKPAKSKTQHKRELSQKVQLEQSKSPELNQRSQAFCEKLCQQKLIGVCEKKKKSKTYRIHLSSSKDKENNSHTHNRVNSISEQRHIFLVQNLQPSQQKSQSFPAIEEDHLTKRLTSNREKSSHSFMIRKKANSTMLQSSQQRNIKNETNKSVHWSKCYRKDKFTKEEELKISASPKTIEENGEIQLTGKTQVRQEIAQHRISDSSQKSIKKFDIIKGGKSLKMRKNKFSKPQEDEIVYEEILTEPNCDKNGPQNIKKFHNTFQNNVEIKKINTLEYEKIKLKQLETVYQTKNKQLEEKRSQGWEKETQLCQIDAIYDIYHQYLPIQSLQNQLIFPPPQSQIIVSKQIKIEKKRVSSIRALKNLYRNIETQEKSELAESRNVQLSKKRQKETPCLTHKIKWGNQTKRKQSLQKISELIGPIIIEVDINKVQQTDPQDKAQKKARFMDEEICPSPKQSESIDNKSRVQGSSRQQSSKPYQSIGSRSMILFEDPGISVIVKKNSSLESSAHVYSTIQQEIQKSQIDFIQENDKQQFSGKKKKQNKNLDNPRLESLKELFLELQSHKSIEVQEQ